MRMRSLVSSSSIEEAKNKLMAALADIRGLCYELVYLKKYREGGNFHIVDIATNNGFNDINAILDNYSDDWLSDGDPGDEYTASDHHPKVGYGRQRR